VSVFISTTAFIFGNCILFGEKLSHAVIAFPYHLLTLRVQQSFLR